MTPTLSLNLSKKLVELGMKLETEKWWHIYKDSDFCVNQINLLNEKPIETGLADDYPAPSASELLEVMPDRLEGIGVLKIYKFPNAYEVTYASIYPQEDKFLCEALGKMVCWLLASGYHYNKEKGGLVR